MLLVFPIRAIEQLRKQISQTYLQLGALGADVIDLYRMVSACLDLLISCIKVKL
jgi:hypothetical protein